MSVYISIHSCLDIYEYRFYLHVEIKVSREDWKR